jgi:hypothetical protein
MFVQTFKGVFGDKRLDARGASLFRSLFLKATQSVRQFSADFADQKGNYRFLENERTTLEAITASMSSHCGDAVKGKVVLSIQDTSEINLYKHKNRIKHDGSVGLTNAPKNGLGFMIHPSLIVDAVNGFPYGFGHVHVYNRSLEREPTETKDRHAYKSLSIEQKESNKWLLSSQAVKNTLNEADTVIIVQDREGDIYEQFATIPDENTHLLIRAKSDRSLPEGRKLFNKVSTCPVKGNYTLEIEGDKRKGQKKRTAQMEVRFTEVEIKNNSRTAQDVCETVNLWCIEAKETGLDKGICWRLLTTLPVTCIEYALMIIEWYSWRWMIEEVFRLLKKEGFDIESSELGTGMAIKKLTLFILDAIIKMFQMRIAYSEDEEGQIPASITFDPQEEECLQRECERLEGKTAKQKNPYPKSSLRYATWVIARLGGWKGYASERPPGLTTLWFGLKRFFDIYSGYTMAKLVYTR